MPLDEQPTDRAECHICRAALGPGTAFCSACGASFHERSVEELRAVLYLLSELDRWRTDGSINPAEAASLRASYERRRDDLRALIMASAEKDIYSEQESNASAEAPAPTTSQQDVTRHTNTTSAEQPASTPASIRFPLSHSTGPQIDERAARRTLVETLAEPYTLRLLLYTGAAMFVVGIIIWLRDVLYLKLQEPVVQAGLLMTGTITLTASGWFTILRTRQRLTGRALTLAGSLLVPVNFWFLVRSGLVADQGRAWVVCAFCTLLYAYTAARLGEKLYVYMSCAASLVTGWALVYRFEPQAPALYALATMFTSLALLHLSRMFPRIRNASEAADASGEGEASGNGRRATNAGGWSYELWSNPLTHAALVGASLAALVYMLLRVGPSLSLYDGIFRLRARGYDSSTAILLFIALGYTAWLAGRYLDARRRVTLYTTSTLALLWAMFLTLDGLRLSARVQILLLATSALVLCLASRRARRSVELSRALYTAGVFASLMLTPVAFAVLLATEPVTLMHSAGFSLLAAAFALLSAPEAGGTAAQKAFAYASAFLASTGFLVALLGASLSSQTLFTAACAAWPFALYMVALMTQRQRLETQLAAPFIRTADVEVALLLLWASVASLVLHLSEANRMVARAAMFCALCGPMLYGFMRAMRERSAFGAGLSAIASIVVVASFLNALKDTGIWPRDWPIAAGVICAAFAIHKATAGLVRAKRWQEKDGGGRLYATIRLVLDAAVALCALLWFLTALSLFERGGFSAAIVLGLAFLYRGERAAQSRAPWPTYMAAAHAGAFFLALLIALKTDGEWFPTLTALVLAPLFFRVAGYARLRGAAWLAVPVSRAAISAMALSFVASISQAMPHLQAGSGALLAPSMTIAALALLSFVVSMLYGEGVLCVHFFRVGLYLSVIAYALLCLRAGFQPLVDVEIYTSPVAVLLLAVAYISYRRAWGEEYARDTSLLFWTGSILLGGPLLLRALQFRLLLDMAAPSRDLATLCAALALLLFGILGRLRAPVLIGAVTLLIELLALTLTSVDWLQVPLKIYLVTVGALLALVGWMFEYRREQLMLIRNRFNERRQRARARFSAWR